MKETVTRESHNARLWTLRSLIFVLAFWAISSQTIARADVISDWNAIGVTACLTARRGPASYVDLAYMHLAVYDAVNAIDGEYSVFAVSPSTVPAGASQEAAAVAAAYKVLIALFPSQNIFPGRTICYFASRYSESAGKNRWHCCWRRDRCAFSCIASGRRTQRAGHLHARQRPRCVGTDTARVPSALGSLDGTNETVRNSKRLLVSHRRASCIEQPRICSGFQ